mgnify:FL=1
MKSNSYTTKIFVLLLCVTAFFYVIIGNGYYMLGACFIPVLHKIFSCFKKDSELPVAWSIFVLMALLSSAFSAVKDVSYKFLFVMIAFLVARMILSKECDWQKFFIKTIVIFSLISVIATFAEMYLPDVMSFLAEKIYSGESLDEYMIFMHQEAYTGIYIQTSFNAYFISVFIAVLIGRIFCGEKKPTNYMLIVIAVIAMILTQKRSFCLANAIAVVIVFWRSSISDKNRDRKVIAMLLLVIAVYLIFRYHPAMQGIMEKMNAMENSGDISNGRFERWEDTIEIWKDHPIFGIGAGALVAAYGISTHNVYLQVMAEMGIVGALSYVVLLLYTLIRSFKIYDTVLRNRDLIPGADLGCAVSIYMQVVTIIYSFFGNPLYGISFMLMYVLFDALIGSYGNIIGNCKI